MVFLLNNGVSPLLVEALWMSKTGNRLRFTFDDAAKRQIKWILAKWTENPHKWRSWNMIAGRSI